MKKLIAILLVFVMVIGLGACKNPVENPGGTTGQSASTTAATNAPTNGTTGADTPVEEVHNNDDLINPEKFSGKKIQIYGYSSEAYEHLENMGQGTYVWMVRAAVDEWATLNGVEVEYVGGYDQSAILGDIHFGGHPDLLLYCNKFSLPVFTGVTRAFTQEEYDALAETCGTAYLDMLKYKDQSYGVAAPWAGGEMLYYNKTQFEKHDVKSPGEYFMEDNWNWDTYETCITEITKDEDGDGTFEVYGTSYVDLLLPQFYRFTQTEDGKLVSLVRDSDACQRFLDIYNHIYGDKLNGKYAACYANTAPRPATSFLEGLWYDFADIHRVLDNGDVIEAVPAPKYTNDAESFYRHSTVYSAILSSCDEPEATLSLINYILRVGMRYMADYSLGLYKCEYEGIRGASEYSAGWKQQFEAIVAQRQAEFDKLTDWDPELYQQTKTYILEADRAYIYQTFPTQDVGTTTYYYVSLSDFADEQEAIIKILNDLYLK